MRDKVLADWVIEECEPRMKSAMERMRVKLSHRYDISFSLDTPKYSYKKWDTWGRRHLDTGRYSQLQVGITAPGAVTVAELRLTTSKPTLKITSRMDMSKCVHHILRDLADEMDYLFRVYSGPRKVWEYI